MEHTLTFDLSIEILEITDISKVSIDDLPKITKKAKKRWHPDRIAQYKDEEEIKKYTKYFQLIEPASEMIKSFLIGDYKAGEKFEQKDNSVYQEPAEVIRKNANNIQSTLNNLWETIVNHKYKHTIQEVLMSDGFKLKDLLTQDFKEDLAGLSIISMIYGTILSWLIAFIVGIFSSELMIIPIIFWGFQTLSCVLGFLPLSRFWLPEQIQNIMFWFINFGLGIYNWANRESVVSNVWVQLLVQIPVLISLAIKYIVLLPIYEIAKLIVGDKVVGVVKQKVDYYAGGAQWYINELLSKEPSGMSEQELFDLSYLYTELSDVKSKI